MTRLILPFSLSAFIAVLLFSASSVSAQSQSPSQDLVQADYDNYARLFRAGQEVNLSPSHSGGNARWEALRRNNRWADYAEESENREPLPAAQVLMGIWLTQNVDYRLTHQIETIIVERSRLSAALAERIILDRIAARLETIPTLIEAIRKAEGITLESDEDIQQMQELVRDVYAIALGRTPTGMHGFNIRNLAIRSVQNLFDHGESGWEATYRFMREKFDILDALADTFTFEDNRQRAFKHIVGTYQSTEHHMEALKAIHRYLLAATEQGDPIAQYHLALFLKYLGDLIDIDKEEIAAYQQWLDQAGNTDLARTRVAEVREQLARRVTVLAERERARNKEGRIAALVRVENDKMDMIEEVIVRVVQRIDERSEQ